MTSSWIISAISFH